jgi:hypothetical protein
MHRLNHIIILLVACVLLLGGGNSLAINRDNKCNGMWYESQKLKTLSFCYNPE